MLSQLCIKNHILCGTTLLKCFIVTCVESRTSSKKGKTDPFLAEVIIKHRNTLKQKTLYFPKSLNENCWYTWNGVRWSHGTCKHQTEWQPLYVLSVLFILWSALKGTGLSHLPLVLCFAGQIQQPAKHDSNCFIQRSPTENNPSADEFCVIPDFKLNIQQHVESVGLIQAQSRSGEISDEFKKSFELMLFAIDLN